MIKSRFLFIISLLFLHALLFEAKADQFGSSSPLGHFLPSKESLVNHNRYSEYGSRGSSGLGYLSPSYNTQKNSRKQSLIPSEVQYERRTLQDFASRDSRLGFIRKVYTIFTGQIITTILITALIMNDRSLQGFLKFHYQEVSIVSSLGSLGVLLSLILVPKLRYNAPTNFILLGIYTFLQSIIVVSKKNV